MKDQFMLKQNLTASNSITSLSENAIAVVSSLPISVYTVNIEDMVLPRSAALKNLKGI
jgi:hypothetical protein